MDGKNRQAKRLPVFVPIFKPKGSLLHKCAETFL